LKKQPDRGGPAPLLLRATAVPISKQSIPDITSRANELWWSGRQFKMMIDGSEFDCPYPAREFGRLPELRLRSLVTGAPSDEEGSHRLLRSDGLVEFSLVQPKQDREDHGANSNML